MIQAWKATDNDLVPDEVQSELIMIRSRLTRDYFRIGDIANRLVLEATKAKAGVTAGRIHKAVGRFCGKSARTVRYYAENAAFFSEDTQCLYQFLPFSFFDFARNFGDQWEDVLKLAADNPSCTLDWLQANYLLHDDSLDSKSSETSLREPQSPAGLQRPVGGLEYGIWCAQTDLNNPDSGKVSMPKPPVDGVRVAPQAGLTAAEFHFVRDVSELVNKAKTALAIAKSDPRVPKSLCGDIAFHLGGLERNLGDFARYMDSPVHVEQAVEQVVDIDG